MRCDLVGRYVAHVQSCQFTIKHFPSLTPVLFLVLLPEPRPDLGPASCCRQVAKLRVQPVAAGFRLTRCNNLDFVTVLNFVGQRHYAAVDLGAAASMADLSVYVISKVERCGAGGHLGDVTFRADRIYAILENVVTNLVEQFVTLVRWFEHVSDETDLLIEGRFRRTAFLVAPVRCNTEFCLSVHIVCAYLHFNRSAFRANHGRMQ